MVATTEGVLVHGGSSAWGRGSPTFDDTWLLDAAGQWTLVSEGGPALADAGVAVLPGGDAVLLAGGHAGNRARPSPQVWRFDVPTSAWTRLAEGPSGRSDAAVAVDAEQGDVYLFGGEALVDEGGRQVLRSSDELWRYLLAEDRWESVTTASAPPGRFEAPAAWSPALEGMVVWGGVITDVRELGDEAGATWRFDPTTEAWSILPTEQLPPPRWETGGFVVDTQGRLLVAGGAREDTSSPFHAVLGDVLRLDPEAGVWESVGELAHPVYGHGVALSGDQLTVLDGVTDPRDPQAVSLTQRLDVSS